MNILIVMPVDDMAEEFTSLLTEDRSIKIISTDSEDEAYELLCSGKKKISAVLEDLPLARRCNFSLIKRINSDPIFAAIPAIAISQKAVTEEDMDCFDEGFSDIICPPGISRHVINRILNCIGAKDSLNFSEIERMLKELPSNIYLKDADGKYIFATHYWHHLDHAGDPGWTIRGKTDYQIRKDKANAIKAMESDKKIIETGEGTSYVIEENDDGIQEFLQLIKRPVFDENGQVTGIIALINDVTEIELLKKELEERTKTDPLTRLLNKSATQDLIEMLVSTGYGVSSDKKCALMMIDVDKFKLVNDIFGHMVGDHVLALIGRLIRENFKGMDVTGRIGGDEFMVFLKDVGSSEIAGVLAKELMKSVKECFVGQELDGYVSLSIGISIFPDDGKSFGDLYHAADLALYHVKENGRDNFHIYDGTENDSLGLKGKV